MSDPVLDRQRARVALRLMAPRDRHVLGVLANVSNMSAEEAAEEMVTRHDGDMDAYRDAVIERATAGTAARTREPWRSLTTSEQSELLVLDALRRGVP